MRYDSEFLRLLKEKYPPGTRIRLTKMNDPYAPIPPGTEGTVDFIDDACGIHMQWDNGRSLPSFLGRTRSQKYLLRSRLSSYICRLL